MLAYLVDLDDASLYAEAEKNNSGLIQELIMSVENMPDERPKTYYENIRQQVEADRAHRLSFTSGPTVRQYAERLRDEMTRRRLRHSPINWPS